MGVYSAYKTPLPSTSVTITECLAATDSTKTSDPQDALTNGHLNAVASSSAHTQLKPPLRVRTTTLQHAQAIFTPEKPLAPSPTVLHSLKAILLASCSYQFFITRKFLSKSIARAKYPPNMYTCFSAYFNQIVIYALEVDVLI